MTFGNPDQWADTMRWWAVAGGALAVIPLTKHVRMILNIYLADRAATLAAPVVVALLTGTGLLAFILFAIAAGSVIPFTARIEGLSPTTPAFKAWMAFAWTLSALGAWATAIAYSRNRYLSTIAAVAWFIAVSFATLATAGPG